MEEETHENRVELIGIYGSDETHALSAWTSTVRDLTPERSERISVMLDSLMKDGHHTPFEKSALHFLVRADTATHIHLLKHRIAVSINVESARYKRLKPKWYTPDDWPAAERKQLDSHVEQSFKLYEETFEMLFERMKEDGIPADDARKRAKESARFYLPYAVQVDMDVMFNWRSFIHFQLLRNDRHAQREVREVAAEMLRLVELTGQFKHTLAAFDNLKKRRGLEELLDSLVREVGYAEAGAALVRAVIAGGPK